MRPPHGTVSWTELITRDVEAAKTFYTATLGWTFDDMSSPEGAYFIAKYGEETLCGIVPMEDGTDAEATSHWFTYIEVDAVDQRLATIARAGGQVLREPFDMPGVGRIAIVEDATGAVMGWITSEEQPQA
jgi:predicted enzyme related to lactoylglutathione lyase